MTNPYLAVVPKLEEEVSGPGGHVPETPEAPEAQDTIGGPQRFPARPSILGAPVGSIRLTPSPDDGPKGPDLNPYLGAVRDRTDATRGMAQIHLREALQKSPDEAAKILQLARETGFSPEGLSDPVNFQQVSEDQMAEMNAHILRNAPATMKIMAESPWLAQLMRDSLPQMAEIEETLKKSATFLEATRKKDREYSVLEYAAGLSRGVAAGVPQFGEFVVGGAGKYYDVLARSLSLPIMFAGGEPARALLYRPLPYGINPSETLFHAPARVLSGLSRDVAGDYEGLAFDAAKGVGQFAAQYGAHVAGRMGSMLSLAFQGAYIFGEQVKDDDVLQWRKDLVTLIGMGVLPVTQTPVFDILGRKIGTTAGPAAARILHEIGQRTGAPLLGTLGVKIADATARPVAQATIRAGVAGVGEFAQEVFENVAADAAQKALTDPTVRIGLAEELEAGVVGDTLYEGQVGGIAGATVSVVSDVLRAFLKAGLGKQRARALQETQKDADEMTRLFELAAEAPARERDPESFAQALGEITEGATVFIDPDRLTTVLAEAGVDISRLPSAQAAIGGAAPPAGPQVFTGKSALFEGYGASTGDVSAGTKRQLMLSPDGGYYWGEWRQEAQRDVGAVPGGADKDGTPASFATSAEARAAAAGALGLPPQAAPQVAPVQPGMEIEIPVAELVSALTGTGAEAALIPHLRVDPEAQTLFEARTESEQARAYFQEEAQRILAEGQRGQDFADASAVVESDILTQLENVQRFATRTNESYAKLIGAFYTTLADRIGITPLQLRDGWTDRGGVQHRGYNLRIGEAAVAGSPALQQFPAASLRTFSAEGVSGLLDTSNWTILTAENPSAAQLSPEENAKRNTDLEAELKALGLEYTPVRGQYGRRENSFAVTGLDYVAAARLGEKYGQESVLTRYGLVYQDGTVDRATGLTVHDPLALPEDFFSVLPDGTVFSVDLEFNREPLADVVRDRDGTEMEGLASFAQSVSTRLPKGKGLPDPHLTTGLDVDYSVVASDPDYQKKLADVMRGWDPFRVTARNPAAALEQILSQMQDNLRWLYNQVPAEIRERSRKWYDGARQLVDRWVAKYDGRYTDVQISGVLAAMSPQLGWDANVSLAERIIDVWTEQQDTAWAAEMEAKAVELFEKPGTEGYDALQRIRGLKLGELDSDYDRGVWVRIYDQTYNPRGYRQVTPEGGWGDWMRNFPDKKGRQAQTKSGWQNGHHTIASAIAILRGGGRDMENISRQLGQEHKVRNFYNNIFDPSDPTSLTVDTHAVAAVHLSPLAGSSPEVSANFGTPESGPLGLSGTYVVYVEAYRRLAKELGILPRELQSIVWEAVRRMYNVPFKSAYAKKEGPKGRKRLTATAKGMQATLRGIWKDYTTGKETIDATHERALEFAGGIQDPGWTGSGSGLDAGAPDSSYTEAVLVSGWTGRPAADRTGTEATGRDQKDILDEGRAGRLDQSGVRAGDESGRLTEPPVNADGTVTLWHWGKVPSLSALDPNMSGTGINGADLRRRDADPDNWTNRTYYGIAVGQSGGYRKESGLGPNLYSTDIAADRLYDMSVDPDGLRPLPGEITGWDNPTSVFEKRIKAAGYAGYWVSHPQLGLTSAVFEKLAAKPAEMPGGVFEQGPALTGKDAEIAAAFEDWAANDPKAVDDYITRFGHKVDPDEAKTFSPEYVADPLRMSQVVHEGSSILTKRVYARLLETAPPGAPVVFSAGGGGSGKTEALQRFSLGEAGVVFDSVLGNYDSAKRRVDQALAAGRPVTILYTNRPVASAWAFALRRPRVVPVEVLAGAHVGASNTIRRLAQEYAADDRVSIAVMDNTTDSLADIAPGTLDGVYNYDYNKVVDELVAEARRQYEQGQITEERFLAAVGQQGVAGRGDRQSQGFREGLQERGRGVRGDGQGGVAQARGTGAPESVAQGERGQFAPDTLELTLLAGADLSTFLHETAHFFLTVYTDLATQPGAPAEVRADLQTFLNQFAGGVSPEQWAAMSIDEQRAAHEAFAESFEQYLFDAKAPSAELKGLFRKFSAFLVRVYGNLRQFLATSGKSADLNPELSAVFDRMLATDAQIENARDARAHKPLFENAADAGMTAEQFARYTELDATSREEAQERLRERSMRDMKWLQNRRNRTIAALQRTAAARRAEVRDQVEEEVSAQPVYQAIEFLRRGRMRDADGGEVEVTEGHKLSIPALQNMYPEGALVAPPDWRALGTGKTGMLAKEGMDPQMAAEMFGYRSGEALVADLVDARPIKDEIEGLTDQRMLEQYSELATPEGIQRAADEAIHNEARSRMVATELAALKAEIGSPQTLLRAAKDTARAMIAGKTSRTLKPWQFAAAETRAGKAAIEALRRGDRAEAARQKRTELLNHVAAKQAHEAVREMEKTVARFRRIAAAKDKETSKTRDMDMVNAVRLILSGYGFVSDVKTGRAKGYLDAVLANNPDAGVFLVDSIEEGLRNAKDWRQLTVEEMAGLKENVEGLWAWARESRLLELDGKQMEIADAQAQLSAKIHEQGLPNRSPGEGQAVTAAEGRWMTFASLMAKVKRVSQWAEGMDGDHDGPFRRFVWYPIKDAADKYRIQRAEYFTQFRDLLKTVSPSIKPGEIDARELGYVFGKGKAGLGKAELLHAILHTGNASNLKKLLLGRGWAELDAAGEMDTRKWDTFIARMISEGKLTKTDFDFAQGVWDMLESMKPAAQKAHRAVFGRYFDEVTADGFDTPWGRYRGGYVPASVDTQIVHDGKLRKLAEIENENMSYSFPSSPKGFTMARVEYNRPLALDLRLLGQHIDKVLIFANMQPAVNDVRRVLSGGGVDTLLNRYDSGIISDMLIPWLNRSARQAVDTQSTEAQLIDGALRRIRNWTGAGLMFGNVINTLQQFTGAFLTMVKVPPSRLGAAMAQFVTRPNETLAFIRERSPFMIDRLNNVNALMYDQVNEILLNPGIYKKAENWSTRHAYIFQIMADRTMAPIAWLGAYNEALSTAPAGMGQQDAELRARRAADAAVQETQMDQSPEGIAAFEAGSPFRRMFTQFAGWFNMTANTMGAEYKKAKRNPDLLARYTRMSYVTLFGFLIPAALSEIIAKAMRGGPDDEDGDGYLDDWLATVGWGTVRYGTAMIPFAGQFLNASLATATGNVYDSRMLSTPVIGAGEAAARTANWLIQLGIDPEEATSKRPGRVIRDAGMAVNGFTGLPTNLLTKPIGYAADVATGEVYPTSGLDFARGMITGTASPDSK